MQIPMSIESAPAAVVEILVNPMRPPRRRRGGRIKAAWRRGFRDTLHAVGHDPETGAGRQ